MSRAKPPVAVVPPQQAAQSERWQLSQAVRIGDLLLCSGQIGTAADGTLPADPGAQFEQAFQNVAILLGAAGLSREHVVDMTTFHVGIAEHLRAFASVRELWLGDVRPAWTAVGVAELAAQGALVEVKVTAWAGDQPS